MPSSSADSSPWPHWSSSSRSATPDAAAAATAAATAAGARYVPFAGASERLDAPW